MSQENVERARQAYRHFNDVGEFDSEFLFPECEFDYSNVMPDVPPFRGLDRANAVLREWTAAFEDFRIEVDRFVDAGDRLIAFVRNTAQVKGSGLPIENHFAQVWTVENNRGIRVEVYLDESKALEAAGLRE